MPRSVNPCVEERNSRGLRPRGLRTLAVMLTALLLVACGSAPTVRSQQMVGTTSARMTRVPFFYQEATMTSRRISGKGDVSVSESETGLYQFGQAMIIRAAPAFQKNGIVVEH